tara:strand:+ start:108 stop:566 length:459 start_codon:yes stop_codon:yes gene_type:complete
MGYDLQSRTGNCFEWQISDYPKALKLAEAYGWQPQGTTNSPVVVDGLGMVAGADPKDWNGGYTSNDCQIVSEVDAANMAEALERALEDIPDTMGKSVYTGTKVLDTSDMTNMQKLFEPEPVNLHDNLSYWIGYKNYLREFISFLKKGSYSTW